MNKIFYYVSGEIRVAVNLLKFMFDGRKLEPKKTPSISDMKDGDQIDCLMIESNHAIKTGNIELTVRLPGSREVMKFLLVQDTQMERVSSVVASQIGVNESDLRFTLDGKNLASGLRETPYILKLENEDEIDCNHGIGLGY
jgi:hypothetical protein